MSFNDEIDHLGGDDAFTDDLTEDDKDGGSLFSDEDEFSFDDLDDPFADSDLDDLDDEDGDDEDDDKKKGKKA